MRYFSKSFFEKKIPAIHIYLLFEREEAAKQWSRREQEWNHEKELREKLMRQVLDQRHEQITEKLEILKQQQEEINEKQQILINDMEQTRKYDLIQKQKQAKEREEKKSLKISIVEQERPQSKLESEKQDDIQRDYNKQKDLVTTKTVEPKVKFYFVINLSFYQNFSFMVVVESIGISQKKTFPCVLCCKLFESHNHSVFISLQYLQIKYFNNFNLFKKTSLNEKILLSTKKNLHKHTKILFQFLL